MRESAWLMLLWSVISLKNHRTLDKIELSKITANSKHVKDKAAQKLLVDKFTNLKKKDILMRKIQSACGGA